MHIPADSIQHKQFPPRAKSSLPFAVQSDIPLLAVPMAGETEDSIGKTQLIPLREKRIKSIAV
jgi:hypothetical protein